MGVEMGKLFRKSTTRDLNGNIINWVDEADGGWIIRNRQIVNQAKYDAYLTKEDDRRVAAQAIALQVTSPTEGQRNGKSETRVDNLEKKVDDMGSKLDAILKALNK